MNRDDAFEAEVLPQLRALFGMAYRLTRNAHDAEDLVQETLLRAYRAFDSYRPGTNVRAWLFTILHRLRTDSLRRRGRSPATVELVGEGPPVGPVHEKVLTSGHEDVVRALEAVPEVFRAAVVLRDVEDFAVRYMGSLQRKAAFYAAEATMRFRDPVGRARRSPPA